MPTQDNATETTPETTTETELNDGLDTETTETEEGKNAEAERVKELEAQIKERDEKIAKMNEKLGKGYKKNAELKEKVDTEYVSKADVQNIIMETQKEITAKQELITKFDDAAELMPEVDKLKEATGLSVTDAYYQVKGKMLADPAYRTQVAGDRAGNFGSISKPEQAKTKAAEILSKGPKISEPIKK